jgi:hypothetical protein
MPKRSTGRQEIVASAPAKIRWQTVRHQVAIAGRLTDAATGKAIEGARVSIDEDGMPTAFASFLRARAMQHGAAWTTMAERPDRTRTAADGVFYFLDLVDGDYSLTASLAGMGGRYGAAQAKATVSRKQNGDYERVFLDLALQATTIRGKVSDAARKNGVPMAEVRVKGSGEHTLSDTRGQYVLAGIQPYTPTAGAPTVIDPPKRTIVVFAQGYKPDVRQVALTAAGAVAQLDFQLVRENG